VTTEAGESVLQLHRREQIVELRSSAAAASIPLSLLTMFAWYRALQAEEDAATVAVITTS